MISVQMSGRTYRALADAGASVTLMRADIANELGLTLYASDLTARGVNSAKLDVVGRTAVPVQLASQVFNQCFHVVEDIAHEVILGVDFLKKLGDVTYNFVKGEFKFNGNIVPMGS